MTAFKTPAQAILARLEANFTTLPIIGGNDNADGIDVTDGFVQIQTTFIDSNFASINKPSMLVRGTGFITIQILTAVNEGEGTGLDFADTIAVIFRGQSFSDVLCFSPTIDSGRQVKHALGEFWETPLICRFKYDEHFAT